jgi:hypothetical protein
MGTGSVTKLCVANPANDWVPPRERVGIGMYRHVRGMLLLPVVGPDKGFPGMGTEDVVHAYVMYVR